MIKYLQKLIPTSPGKSEVLKPVLWLIGLLLVANLAVAGVMIKIPDHASVLSPISATLRYLLAAAVGYALGMHKYLVEYNIEELKGK